MNKIYFLLIVILFVAFDVMAVPPPGGSGPAPIDGGVMLLAGAGIAYGITKMRKQNKENKTEE